MKYDNLDMNSCMRSYEKKCLALQGIMYDMEMIDYAATRFIRNSISNGFTSHYAAEVAHNFSKSMFNSAIVQDFMKKVVQLVVPSGSDAEKSWMSKAECTRIEYSCENYSYSCENYSNDVQYDELSHADSHIALSFSDFSSLRSFILHIPIADATQVKVSTWKKTALGLYYATGSIPCEKRSNGQVFFLKKLIAICFDSHHLNDTLNKFTAGNFDDEILDDIIEYHRFEHFFKHREDMPTQDRNDMWIDRHLFDSYQAFSEQLLLEKMPELNYGYPLDAISSVVDDRKEFLSKYDINDE